MKNTITTVLFIWSALYTRPTFLAYAQSSILELDSDPVVEFVVTDPLGRRTGYDFVADQTYSEIPHARYSYEGIEGEDRYSPQFITGPSGPPIDGLYLVRVIGVEFANFSLGYNIDRDGTRSRQYVKESAAPGRVLYYQLTYSSNPGVPITLVKVPATNQVSGGIFNPSGSTLSVKAKPSVNFTSGSLKTLVATIRWPTAYGITFGTPSSPIYGFAKWDSVIVSGIYSYQKFRAAGAIPINWQANTEYELFTTDVSGGTGLGTFELTNAVPGGEWFVDIDYSDKSDTTFYQPAVSGTPLPIQLYYFTAFVLPNERVQLDWGTLTELNNYGFEVQESQSPTSGFTSIPGSFTPGHGTTNEPQAYSYIDQNTTAGWWYYRLKQIDLDGTLHYTEPVQVNVPGGTETQVANFTAIVLTDNTVRLDWMTLREGDNSGFEVQESRSGTSGFTTISGSFTPGHPNSPDPIYYSYIDLNTSSGVWYYRLKQIDLDGTPHYLDPVSVTIPDGQIEVEALTGSTLSQQGVQLQWATRRETNNARFEVQTSRGDSLQFRPIPNGVVLGHGTTTTRYEYSYRDRRPTAGTWYYRLKQYNSDGRVRYTRHIRLNVQ